MTIGPGKYDDVCTLAREKAKAGGVILIVVNGERGSGFSCQADLPTMALLPDMLEHLARQIREDLTR